MDELYELADTFTWELFPAAVFDIDEEWDATTMSFSHPNIDCYLSLTGRLDTTHGTGLPFGNAWRTSRCISAW